MGIPQTQLDTWARQGAIQTAKNTHETIRKALDDWNHFPEGINFVTYLQGSYVNDTNIRGDSDVDVVVELKTTYLPDLTKLSHREKALYEKDRVPADYKFDDFKIDVLDALFARFGRNSVKPGDKAIKIEKDSNRVPADVVPTITHRRFVNYYEDLSPDTIEGISLYSVREQDWIINYPKKHKDNCIAKQKATNGWFKPLVRVVKNMRTRLVDNEVISKELAPSYFIEGLLFNVPNPKFGKSYEDTFVESINWILSAEKSSFICPNAQQNLFGGGGTFWSEENANTFIDALVKYWNEWV